MANLNDQLRQVAQELLATQAKILQVAAATLAAHAEQVAGDARALAPVDTGELRDSIQAVQQDELHYQVEATAPYAADVELGTRNQAAQPFLFPAYEANRSRLADKMRDNLRNAS